MTLLQGIYRATVLCLTLLWASSAYGQMCKRWTEAVRIGALQAQLKEASGLAASRKFPGRLYHLNDSGDSGRFYLTGMDGKNTQAVSVAGFNPMDAEGLSLGVCPGSRASCIYLGDIGDNEKKRSAIEIAVVEELQKFPPTAKPKRLMKLRYPDGPHDAESMAIHPDGTIYILTKESPARLFKGRSAAGDQTLAAVTTIEVGGNPTDMAISDDGQRLLILTYRDAVEYSLDLKQKQNIRLNFLQQQEAVTYLPGSRSFLYTSEQLLPGLAQWIMRVDCAEK